MSDSPLIVPRGAARTANGLFTAAIAAVRPITPLMFGARLALMAAVAGAPTDAIVGRPVAPLRPLMFDPLAKLVAARAGLAPDANLRIDEAPRAVVKTDQAFAAVEPIL